MDERFRRILPDARAGNLGAALQLAHELSRIGALPPPGEPYSQKPISLFPFPSYRIEMLPSSHARLLGESGADGYGVVSLGVFRNADLQPDPFDVCVIPVTNMMVNVVVGRPYGRPVEFQEGVFTGELRFPSSRRTELLGPRSPWAMPLHGNPFIYYRLCSTMRGPVYETPGGKRYELNADTTFVVGGEGYFRTWSGAMIRFTFEYGGIQRPRPRGYAQIARRARILTPSITRAVNEFLREHPEVFELPSQVPDVSELARALQEMAQAETRLAALQNRVATLALEVSDILGL